MAILPLLLREPLLELPAGSSAAPDDEVLLVEEVTPAGSGVEVVVIVTMNVLEDSPDLVGVTTEVRTMVVTAGELVRTAVGERLVVVGVVGVVVGGREVVGGVLVVGGGADVVGGVLVVAGVVGVSGFEGVVVAGGGGGEVGSVVTGDKEVVPGGGELVSGGCAVVGGLVGEFVKEGTLVVGDAGGSDVLGLLVLVLLDMVKARCFNRGISLRRTVMLATETTHVWYRSA
jgi:hypothetical protein